MRLPVILMTQTGLSRYPIAGSCRQLQRSEEGKKQLKEQVAYYMKNAAYILDGLKEAGYEVYGGKNAPYIWLKTPDGMSSWDFFDRLLSEANVVGTPGAGFGPCGEGYFRLTSFGARDKTIEAMARIAAM